MEAGKSNDLLLRELQDLREKVSRMEKELSRCNEKREDLSFSEETHRMIVNNVKEGIVIIQNDDVKFYNEPVLNYIGNEVKELKRLAFLEYIHPDDRALVEERYKKRLRGEEAPPRYSVRFRTPKGEEGWLEINVSSIMWQGEPATLSFITDITEQKRSEEVMRQSEERYRSLVENTLEGFYVYEVPSGQFLFLNQRCCDLLGYPLHEGLTSSFLDFLAADEKERAKERIQVYLARSTEVHEPQVYKVRKKDGSIFRAEVSGSLVIFQGKTAIQGTLRDITERERLEQQLQHAQKMHALGSLAGGAAHEFNNLLTAIQGNTQLLSAHLEKDHPLSKYTREINASCHRAAQITRRMLAFSRAETGSKVPVKVNQLIQSVVTLLKQTLSPEIIIELDLESGLPFVMAEPAQLEQVFLNLGMNAQEALHECGKIKFTTRSSGLGKSFSHIYPWAKPGRYMEVTIQDDGEGMAAEVMEKIFDPFFTTKKSKESTGLGLPIAYSIIKNHGGYILAESEVGSGSRFRVFLPLLEEEIEWDEEDDEEEAPLPYGNERILIVDDEPQVLEVARTMLLGSGYRVTGATNGKEGLQLFKKARENGNPYDIVILDLVMPVMDGKACLEKLLELDPNARVLILTGYYNEQFISSELGSKVCGVLMKPFDAPTLLRAVRKSLCV